MVLAPLKEQDGVAPEKLARLREKEQAKLAAAAVLEQHAAVDEAKSHVLAAKRLHDLAVLKAEAAQREVQLEKDEKEVEEGL